MAENVTLILECMARDGQGQGEPYAVTIEKKVKYEPEPPAEGANHTFVFGLKREEDDDQIFYLANRLKDEDLFEVLEDEDELRIGFMKISWEDNEVQAGFFLSDDKQKNVIRQQEAGTDWVFLLARQGNSYRLFYMKLFGPGAVDKCQAIRDSFDNPDSQACKTTLQMNDCPI